MTDTRGPSEPGPKLLGTLRSKVRIALASAAILTVGLLAAPERRPTPLAPPQERAAPRIEADVQTRSPGRALPGTVELAARHGPGNVTYATGYLANFREAVQPMSTGGVLLPPG